MIAPNCIFVAGIAGLTVLVAQSTLAQQAAPSSACTTTELQSVVGALGSGQAQGGTTPPVVAGAKCLDCIIPCFQGSATTAAGQSACLATCGSVAPPTPIVSPPAAVAPASLSPPPVSLMPATFPPGGLSGGQSPPVSVGSPPASGPAGCLDREVYCASYTQIGLCTAQAYAALMSTNCRASCGLCTGTAPATAVPAPATAVPQPIAAVSAPPPISTPIPAPGTPAQPGTDCTSKAFTCSMAFNDAVTKATVAKDKAMYV